MHLLIIPILEHIRGCDTEQAVVIHLVNKNVKV